MLFDDRERVMDCAEEYGLEITEDNVDDVIDRCAAMKGVTKDRLVLPFEDADLVSMLKEAVDTCVSM